MSHNESRKAYAECKQTYETIEELSTRLRLPKSWIYSRTRQNGPGSIPVIKAGKYCLFVPEQVDQWLQDQQNR